jgi:hypothetical protein
MSNFQLKSSRYDFDHILEKKGYAISHDQEDRTVFSKKIDVSNYQGKFREDELKGLCLNVTRPKILDSANKYEVCSPYVISFNYFVIPHHAIRRMRWDTFPGHIPEVFEAMLRIAEDEAKICAKVFMETDTMAMVGSYIKKAETTETTENKQESKQQNTEQ